MGKRGTGDPEEQRANQIGVGTPAKVSEGALRTAFSAHA